VSFGSSRIYIGGTLAGLVAVQLGNYIASDVDLVSVVSHFGIENYWRSSVVNITSLAIVLTQLLSLDKPKSRAARKTSGSA
jgi:hypothetical protein